MAAAKAFSSRRGLHHLIYVQEIAMRAMAVAGVRSPPSERKYAPTSASPASTVSPTPFNRVPRSTAACKIVPECFAVMSPV